MKKILLFVSAVIFSVSCSSDDNEINNSSNSKITPPEWIQGTWTKNGAGYKFTSDDFCQISPMLDNCWKTQIENANSLSSPESYKLKVTQEISDSNYSILMGNSSSQSFKFVFKKKSNNEIIWSNAPGFTEEQLELFTYKKQ